MVQGANYSSCFHADKTEHVRQDQSQPTATTSAPSAPAEADRPNLMPQSSLAAEEVDSDPVEMHRKARIALEVHRKARIALAEEIARAREAKELYFFYGSLMFPRMLQHILDLPELPELKPAEVVGLHMKMWGPYPALVDGEEGEVVKGVAFEVEGSEQKEKLARYETDCYRTREFYINVLGEAKILGTVFVWNGDADELDEGVFDVAKWEKRMNRVLNR